MINFISSSCSLNINKQKYLLLCSWPVPITWLLSHHSLSFVFLLLHWQYHIFLPHNLLFLTWIIVTSNALSFSLLINISQSNAITSMWLWIHYILCQLSNLYHLWTIYLKNLSYYIYTYNFWLLPILCLNLILLAALVLIKVTTTHSVAQAITLNISLISHFPQVPLSSFVGIIIKFCRHYHLNTSKFNLIFTMYNIKILTQAIIISCLS